jgi:hypothetical protein
MGDSWYVPGAGVFFFGMVKVSVLVLVLRSTHLPWS